MKGTLYAVGVGPGDPELLTLKAIKTLLRAEVIACPAKGDAPGVAYRIAERAMPDLARKETLLLSFPMEKSGLAEAHEKAAARIIERLEAGRHVALLTLGDPTLYATASYVIGLVRQAGHPVEIVSGVPSFCAAAARMCLPLAMGEDPLMISPGAYRDFPGTLVVLKAGSRLKELKAELRDAGKAVCLVENCGMENERVWSDLDAMPDETGYFSVLIVK